MDIAEVIRSRRTIHRYTEEPIEEALLHEAIEMLIWAPNHKATHPWAVTSIGPQTRKVIADIFVALRGAQLDSQPGSELVQAWRQIIINPAALLAIGCKKLSQEAFQAREDYASVACGIQNTSLFLWSKGYGSKWSTGAITRDPRTYTALEIDPEAEEIIGFLFIGKFTKENMKTPTRPKLEEVLKSFP